MAIEGTIPRKILDLIDAALAAPASRCEVLTAQVWQPIETAPKDGTRFWAFQGSKEEQQYVCWWKEDFAHWEGWQTIWDDEPAPTHWMPLPDSPPVPSAQSGGVK